MSFFLNFCLPLSSSVGLCFSFTISLNFFPAPPQAFRAVFLCVPPTSPDSCYPSAVLYSCFYIFLSSPVIFLLFLLFIYGLKYIWIFSYCGKKPVSRPAVPGFCSRAQPWTSGEKIWPTLSGRFLFSACESHTSWGDGRLLVGVSVLPGHCKAHHDLRDCTSTGVQLWHVSKIPHCGAQQQSPLAPLVNLCLLFSYRGGGIRTREAFSFLPLADL